MTLILRAPLPDIQTTTILPSPQFGDSEAPRLAVTLMQATDGTQYSYVKSNARSKLLYTFLLTRMKALELRAFVQSYYRADISVLNHKGETWFCKLTSNPFEFDGEGRAGGLPGGEMQTITLEFDGTKVS